MAEKMTLLPCPFCGAPAAKNKNPGDRWVYYCPNGHTGYLRHKEWQARAHLAQPSQAALYARCEDCSEPTGKTAVCITCAELRCDSVLRAAQAVDVGAIREVIVELRDKAEVPALIRAQSLADKLTRAISNAQAEGK